MRALRERIKPGTINVRDIIEGGPGVLTGIVIDAAVALAWVFPDEHNAAADAILESLEHQAVVVPANWSVEVADALAAGEQTGTHHRGQRRFVTLLETLDVVEYACEPASASQARLAVLRPHRLRRRRAMCENLPLATFDLAHPEGGRDAPGRRVTISTSPPISRCRAASADRSM